MTRSQIIARIQKAAIDTFVRSFGLVALGFTAVWVYGLRLPVLDASTAAHVVLAAAAGAGVMVITDDLFDQIFDGIYCRVLDRVDGDEPQPTEV